MRGVRTFFRMAAERPPTWQIVVTVLAGVWATALAAAGPVVGYLADQYFAVTDGDHASGGWAVAATLVATVLAVIPSALLGWRGHGSVRPFNRAWVLALGASAVLALPRLTPVPYHEFYLVELALLAAVTSRYLRRGTRLADRPWRRAPALAGGLAMLLPWAWLGALGGPTETVAAFLAALAVGRLATVLQHRVRMDGSWPRRVLLTGLAGIPVVAALAGSTGLPAVALVLLAVLPLLAFGVAALRPGSGLLIGLAAAGPLAFLDPEEVSLLLGGTELLWTLLGAALALGIALLVDAGFGATYGRLAPPPRPVVYLVLLVTAVAFGTLYVGPGRPGFHGERLFVVMSATADLSGVAAIPDRAERLRETYRRLVATADSSQAALRKGLRGLRVGFTPFYLTNGLEVDGGPAVRAWLDRQPGVRKVLNSPRLRPLPRPPGTERGTTTAPVGPQWNIQLVGADRAWAETGAQGAGITVGTSDSGVDGRHPLLANRFRGGDDSWYDPWNGTTTPTDHNGHGTHTLGTAVGDGGIGVAPQAQWVGCVNLDRNMGNPAYYLQCLQFMLAPFPHGGDPLRDGRPERAPHILTNSWGCPSIEGCDNTVIRPAVTALTTAGVYFVSAAGNAGPRCGSIDDEPAVSPEALDVGAVDRQSRLATFSSRGDGPSRRAPDVVAPGQGVLSAMPGGTYATLDGTSMAAPHVAGVVALMWSANPALIGDIARTTAILRDTARPATPTYRSRNEECGGQRYVIGAGLVDAYAAVRAATG
ncbi:peptidase S8 [Virgisporangium aliadipatigenens]|uniref:Peptidase S8 n=2 Tax=Virgisporangium aliadipatigenens TaxID=741659 RepID=A0A8J3YTI8_9ACTN|nr:S8 family serine peptidase [Virgisporangium aliadipatigenens]GIJ51589.1 peptidase S8 [Virgisporangium aliadipatigenens]